MVPAPTGALIAVCMLMLICLAPGVAAAAEPSPQKAPSTAPLKPDPAPQAQARSQPTHSTTTTAPAPRTARTDVAPRIVHVAVPHQTVAHVSSASVTPSRAPTPSPAKVSHHPPPRHPVAHRPAADPISLSFVVGILPANLVRLPRAGLNAGDPGHRDGVLLLLSSVAMAVLAVSSFALLRRLRKLEAV